MIYGPDDKPIPRPNTRTSAAILALALIMTTSCRSAREGEIPGEYTAKLDWGESKLVIKTDHTFKQTVRTNNGAARTLDGKWQFNNGLILLMPCLSVTHDSQGVDAESCASGVDVIGFRRVEISLDPDYGIAYRNAR